MLGQSPERDHDIEQIQTMIKNCAAAKIPCVKYNMSILGVLRTGRVSGRGDTTYSAYKLKDAHADPPLTRAGCRRRGPVLGEITYFLQHVIPVATEYKVRMACHPNDSPRCPPEGYQRRQCGSGHSRRSEEICLDPREPLSRTQFLPGDCLGNAAATRVKKSTRSFAGLERARRSSTFQFP
jgi:hypothetical protein